MRDLSAVIRGATATDTRPHTRRHRRLTLVAVCVASFMILLDLTIVNVALPRMQSGLQMTPGALEWVISGYALALAASIPATGTLGDLYGRKRLFLLGMIVFTLGSLACAFSSSAPMLIAARVVEALGGAAMLALSLSIITETYPTETRAGAIGWWAAISGTGFGLGPVVGGLLLSSFDWQSVFWVNIPIGVIGVVLVAFGIRESRDPASRRLDLPGVATSSLGLVALTFGLIDASSHPWSSWWVVAPLLLGAAALVAFTSWERRARNPMVPVALLRARSFATSSAVYLVVYAAQAAMLFYATLLYQDVLGWSALRTGLSWLFLNVAFLLVAEIAGPLNRHLSSRALVGTGCALVVVGLVAVSFAGPGVPFLVTAVGYVVSGAGFGAVNPGVTHAAMRDVPSGVSGAASGVFNASRQLGTSMGLALLGSIGVSATITAWRAHIPLLPRHLRAAALGQGQDVGAAHLRAVTGALGPAPRHLAVTAFVHGYHVALLAGAVCAAAAGIVAVTGFRSRTLDTPPEAQLT